MTYKRQIDRLPIVPPDAKEHNVTCHFCIVGCGYKAYTWDINKQGGTDPGQNKFKADLAKQQGASAADVVNQKLAIRLLEQMGYRADLASNGIEAVESLERQIYDVILMDVQMPEMDGLEATRIIRKLMGAVQPHIIAMTANAMEGDREMCIAAGMNDYISKPIRINDLVDALMRAERKN